MTWPFGPAKLESFELFWRGQPQRSPWELLRAGPRRPRPAREQAALLHDSSLGTSSDEGIVIRVGEKIEIMTHTRTAANAPVWDALETGFIGNLSFCYCSVFNECWIIDVRFGTQLDLNPPPVRACPRPRVRYDNILEGGMAPALKVDNLPAAALQRHGGACRPSGSRN